MKWYQSILAFLTGFLNLNAGSEEQDIHEELQSTLGKYGTFSKMKEALREEFEEDLKASFQEAIDGLQSGLAETEKKYETAIARLNDASEKINAQAAEIEALKKQPAAAHTEGAAGAEEETAGDIRPYVLNPVYLKAKGYRESAARARATT